MSRRRNRRPQSSLWRREPPSKRSSDHSSQQSCDSSAELPDETKNIATVEEETAINDSVEKEKVKVDSLVDSPVLPAAPLTTLSEPIKKKDPLNSSEESPRYCHRTPLSLHLKPEAAPQENSCSIGLQASPTSLSLPVGSPRSTVSYDRSSAPQVDYEKNSDQNSSAPQPADLLLVSASVGVGAALVDEAIIGAADEEDRGWRSRGLSSDLSSTGCNMPDEPIDDDHNNKPLLPELKYEQNVFVLNFKFNQDGTCFVASTTQGFRVYTCRPLSEFARREVVRSCSGKQDSLDPTTVEPSEISTTCIQATSDKDSSNENTVYNNSLTVSNNFSKKTLTDVDDGANNNNNNIASEQHSGNDDGLLSIFPSRTNNYAIKLVAMLYRSHSFAIVTAAEPQKVLLWNDRERRAIGWIRCRYPVLDIAMRREVIAVVTAHAVYVYLSGTVSPLHVIPTGHNPQGIVALSAAPDTPWVLCCPALTPGGVRVQQGVAPEAMPVGPLVFQAHQSQVALLSLNYRGTMVASASTQGTVIRISATADGTPLREFRLGVVPHAVSCIAFRRDDAFIAVASDSETIHVFKMDFQDSLNGGSNNHQLEQARNSRVWSNISAAVLGQGREVLRTVFPRYFTPARAFATLALQPEADVRACGRHALLLHIRSTQCETCRLSSQRKSSKLFSQQSADTVGLKFRAAAGGEQRRRKSSGVICEFESTMAASYTGPQVSFTGESSNHLFIVHHDGFVYEARFDATVGGKCRLLSMAPWFAPRTDFSILGDDSLEDDECWGNNNSRLAEGAQQLYYHPGVIDE